jgi:aerobic carbon-monoxide dehydrogenase large subunit
MHDVLSSRPGATREAGIVGQRVKRLEDPRLITGQGMFIEDLKLPGILYMQIVRSTEAHGRITKIDASGAAAAEGVRLVLTGSEVNREVRPLPVRWDTPGLRCREYPPMADERVRYAGQPIALIVADDPSLAEDAALQIKVEYESLQPVVDVEEAFVPGAPLLYEEWSSNETCEPVRMGQGDIAAAFAQADCVIKARLYSHRYSGFPLEPRGCIAVPHPVEQLLTIYSSTQAPNQVRTAIAGCLGVGENSIRVKAWDVGGGFGVKDQVYPEEVMVSYVARKLGVPVKWVEGRSESFFASTHAREQVHYAELAVKSDGTVLAIKDTILYDAGAHHESRGALPSMLTASMLPGPYKIGAAEIVVHPVVTNKVPSGAYRGFGMTQATFVMERLLDMAAAELGLDPADIRRKNFIPPEQVPTFVTATGAQYDSGDYPKAFERVLDLLGYEEYDKKLRGYKQLQQYQQEQRAQGRYLGIGLASFVESTGLGPSKFQEQLGFLIPSHETARVVMDMSGKVTVHTGIMPIGQGAQTALSQIAADCLGVSLEDVRVIWGDTDACPYSGLASVASRGTAVGGAAIRQACEPIFEKLKRIAGNRLEARPDDIEIRAGQVSVSGVPGKILPLSEIARAAYFSGPDLPEGEKPGLSNEEVYDPSAVAFASGSHACLVEVDIETGFVEVLKYCVCHDCGTMVNPALVEAQVHGGVMQGLGGALMEELPYDKDGHLLVTNFTDYHLPRAGGMPQIQVDHIETPAPHIPGGFKGAGEGGVIPSPAAIANAVADALRPFRVRVTSTPLTPPRVWELLHPSSQAQEAPTDPGKETA